MVDKVAITREAQKYLAKGQVDKAIAEWEKLLKEAPDGTIFNTVGDLYLKSGNKQGAIDAYHKASRIFRNEGFSLKALALYKKILNINPQDGDALFALGELNEEKNIIPDAIKYYLAATDVFSKQNNKNSLIKTYDKILTLAPTNIPLRVKISELFSKEGFVEEASKEFIAIGKIFAENGDTANEKKYLLKALEIQPRNIHAQLAMSAFAEKEGNIPDAIKHIQKVINIQGESADLLLRIANLHIKDGSMDAAREFISKVTAIDPSNTVAKRLLGDAYIKAGDMTMAWQEYNTVLDEMIFKEKYDEAIEILTMFKEIDPIESRRKLVSLFKTTGDNASAVQELIALGDIYDGSGLKSDAMKCCTEALTLDPDNEAVKEMIKRLELDLGIESELEIETQKTPEEMITEADIFLRYGLYDEARKHLESLKMTAPENTDVHEKLKSLYIDINDKELAVTECLILSELFKRSGNDDARNKVMSEAFEINPEDPRLIERERPAVEKPIFERGAVLEEETMETSLGGTTIEDFSEDIAEAEFYVKQGLPIEAVKIYNKLIEIFPENEELREKALSIEGIQIESEGFAGQGTVENLSIDEFIIPEAGPQEIQEQEEVKEPELQSDVLEIFEEFKKGLAQDLEAEDYETHYNLGIAYKEMGLIDDAINEFQTAKKDPKFFIQAVSTLGMCYMQKELYPLAIDALSTALMKLDPKEESSWSMKYDLAEAYEKNGNIKEAFQFYTEVYGWNSRFRDVSIKISRLREKNLKPKTEPLHETKVEVQAQEIAEPETAPIAETPPPQAGETPPKPKKSRVSYI